MFSIWSWLSLLIFLLWWSSLESSICFCPWNMHIKVVCQRIHQASFIRWSTSCGFFLPRCHMRHSTMVIHCPVCGWWYHVIMAGTLFTNLYVISLHEPNLCVWLDHEVQELETLALNLPLFLLVSFSREYLNTSHWFNVGWSFRVKCLAYQ